MSKPDRLDGLLPGILVFGAALVLGYIILRQPAPESPPISTSTQLRPEQIAEMARNAEADREADRLKSELNQRQQALEDQAQVLSMQQAMLDQQSTRTHDSALQASWLANGLALATPLKLVVTEAFMIEGRFPDDNADVGYPAAEEFAAEGVRSIGIIDNGIIQIVYDHRTGRDNGTVLLTPTFKASIGRLEWRCSSSDFPRIEAALRTCEYEG